MSLLTDRHDLQTDQYKDASNLNARICVHQRFSTNQYAWQRWVFDHLDLPSHCDILDVGCGSGNLWLENMDRTPAGWTVVLSDVTLGMVQNAHRRLGCRFVYHVMDAQALPFPDKRFDAIVANHMLFHVPDRHKALYEMERVLRPGGYLYAATNGRSHLQELKDLVATFCPDADIPNVAAEFGLENGAPQLVQHFAQVKRHRQANALVVTEAEPLIDYAMSMMCQADLRKNEGALRRSIRETIAQEGAFQIKKDGGMFAARKAW